MSTASSIRTQPSSTTLRPPELKRGRVVMVANREATLDCYVVHHDAAKRFGADVLRPMFMVPEDSVGMPRTTV